MWRQPRPRKPGVTAVVDTAVAVGGTVAGTGAGGGGSSATKRSRHATGRSSGTGPFFFDLGYRPLSKQLRGQLGAAREEADQALSRLWQGETVRREDVSLEKISRERKASGKIAFGNRRIVVAKERRQLEQLRVIRLARLTRDGAARAGRLPRIR